MSIEEGDKDFAVKALQRIISIQENYHKLKSLGVDLIDYENGVNLIEEAIARLFITKESDFEKILDDIQWWLYEKVDKIITIGNGAEVEKRNVSKPEDFIKWISEWYNQQKQ